MEYLKVNIIKINGVLMRLPGPGVHFQPTDEDLIRHYLKNKVMSCPLPADIIKELNVYKSDPWDFPGDSEEERYFFSQNEAKYPNGSRVNRATNSGYWKASGVDKKIVVSEGNQVVVVGMKKTLFFYIGKLPNCTKTDWVMHEYRLADGSALKQLEGDAAAKANWVLCRVFLKNKNKKAAIAPPASSCNSDSSADELMEETPPTHETEDHEESVNSCN